MPHKIRKKKNVEILLEKVAPHPSPKWKLEQYTIPANLAAHILWIAHQEFQDIEGKVILDLGCGTGRLAIGAALLPAKLVIGIDMDLSALKEAREDADQLGVDANTAWVLASLPFLKIKADVVLQNPPFGTKIPKTDSMFLQTALQNASTAYSLHKSTEKGRRKITQVITKMGGNTTDMWPMEITIPHLFKFHRKRLHQVSVDLLRIVTNRR